MAETIVVMTCGHAMPGVNNKRFTLLGRALYDIRPDIFINLGDTTEFESLSSFDSRYPKKVSMRSYEQDIRYTRDAHAKIFKEFRHHKKRKPYSVFLHGNHEYRLPLALAKDPGLEGSSYGLSLDHLGIDLYYHENIGYHNNAPGIYNYGGIGFAHFLAGSYGKAITYANKLIEKRASSFVCGHTHSFDYAVKEDAYPNPIRGLIAGCFLGDDQDWAGHANAAWSRGIAILHNVENGSFDLEWMSMNRLEKSFG